jgi:hypothetical protein
MNNNRINHKILYLFLTLFIIVYTDREDYYNIKDNLNYNNPPYKLNLSEDTEIVHGHGMATTIEWLKQNNPFFQS